MPSRLLATALVCVVVSGCATFPAKNVTSWTTLAPDEGYLVTKVRTNVVNSYIYVHGRYEDQPWALLRPVRAPEDLRLIKIKGGEAYFSKFFQGNGYVFGPKNYFTVEPGTVTYVGDLVAEWVSEKGGISAYILPIDREEETVSEAKALYPWIFENHPYRKSVAAADCCFECLSSKEFEEAISACLKNLETERPDKFWHVIYLAAAYLGVEKHDEALAALELYRKESSDDEIGPMYYVVLSRAYHEAGRLYEAVQACTDGLAKYPDNLLLYFRRYISHDALGEKIMAQADVDRMMSIYPGTPDELRAYLSGQQDTEDDAPLYKYQTSGQTQPPFIFIPPMVR